MRLTYKATCVCRLETQRCEERARTGAHILLAATCIFCKSKISHEIATSPLTPSQKMPFSRDIRQRSGLPLRLCASCVSRRVLAQLHFKPCKESCGGGSSSCGAPLAPTKAFRPRTAPQKQKDPTCCVHGPKRRQNPPLRRMGVCGRLRAWWVLTPCWARVGFYSSSFLGR